MKNKIMILIMNIYRTIFLRKSMYRFNRKLFELSLRALEILNYENSVVNGENYLLKFIYKIYGDNPITLVDIGANIGSYSRKFRNIFKNATIYCMEPNPNTFKLLNNIAETWDLNVFNVGCGEIEEDRLLFDYDPRGSSHASLYKEVIAEIHHENPETYNVKIITLNNFVKNQSISKIHLLKIDTEGNEIFILKGGKQLIESNLIDIIHFEFNEMNVISRVFFRDFLEIFHNYNLYRLLQNGLLPLFEYCPVYYEIFAYQNIVAINKNCNIII